MTYREDILIHFFGQHIVDSYKEGRMETFFVNDLTREELEKKIGLRFINASQNRPETKLFIVDNVYIACNAYKNDIRYQFGVDSNNETFINLNNNKTKMKPEHKIILQKIEEYLAINPNQRFGQALTNLKVIGFADEQSPEKCKFLLRDNYNDKDEEIMSRILNYQKKK